MMRIFFIFLVLFLVACQKEEVNSIDDRLLPYIESFQKEAELRGIEVNDQIQNLEAEVQTIVGDVVGQCKHNDDYPNQIFIDYRYWNEKSELDREFLVYHELGHCILDREHLDSKDNNGVCISIMHSTGQACINGYTYSTRSEYLDELFSK